MYIHTNYKFLQIMCCFLETSVGDLPKPRNDSCQLSGGEPAFSCKERANLKPSRACGREDSLLPSTQLCCLYLCRVEGVQPCVCTMVVEINARLFYE